MIVLTVESKGVGERVKVTQGGDGIPSELGILFRHHDSIMDFVLFSGRGKLDFKHDVIISIWEEFGQGGHCGRGFCLLFAKTNTLAF